MTTHLEHPEYGVPVVPRANDVYSGMRLLYGHDFEMIFLERRTLGQLARVVLPCVVFGFLLASAATAVLVLTGTYKNADPDRQTALVAATSFVAFWAGFLVWSVRRQKLGIASWQVIVDDRADAADLAKTQLRRELDRRLQSVHVARSEIDRRGRWAVRVRLRTFNCYVSVFPFGRDLFVGWAMLDEPNFWNVFGGWLSDLFRGGSWFNRELRSYVPKALRDTVHNATREAVAAAAASSVAFHAAAPASATTVPAPSAGDSDLW